MNITHWKEKDRAHCWHPFTQQEEWENSDSTFLTEGQGVWLTDTDGNTYLDGNSSIWTNIHGHNHPNLNQAIINQLANVAHTSYLGYAHPLASELASRLCHFFPADTLERCFFSDNGSTALEVAMKLSLQSRQQSQSENSINRNSFIAFQNAYHGDTMGAASLGGVARFFDRFAKLGLPVTKVGSLDDVLALSDETLQQTTAIVIEPIIQGVNQMTPWPSGMLASLRDWCDENDIHLILDEVMTGFGRTGTMFACQQEDVVPDFLCLAKGLTGGYMPMGATLTTNEVYKCFFGGPEKVFFYGHSYTANQLGCAAALASLETFESEETLSNVAKREKELAAKLQELQEEIPRVFEVRQYGLISAVDLRYSDGDHFDPSLKVGRYVCEAGKKFGLLTRPILDTVVFMPPLCITKDELEFGIDALKQAILQVVGMIKDT